MDGTATDIEMATLLTALRMKGEKPSPSHRLRRRSCAKRARTSSRKARVMDIVGTGGDDNGSFNIFHDRCICGGGGVLVAKHGNRSVSSKSGAADVPEELMPSCRCRPSRTKGAGGNGHLLLSAQGYQRRCCRPWVRKGMGERTIFNVPGPWSIWRARPCSCSACTMKNWSCRWRRC